MEPIINKLLPEFTLQAYHNGAFKTFSNHDVMGRWALFLFYPADFSSLCYSEHMDMEEMYGEFMQMWAEIYSVSCDSHLVHKAWIDGSEGIGSVSYPMLSDPMGKLARVFGVMNEEIGMAYRGTFVVDPKGVIKMAEINDNSIGRSVDDMMRKLQAAQYAETHNGEVCPAKWRVGSDTIKPTI